MANRNDSQVTPDIRIALKNLVTKQSMQGLYYYKTTFSFNTVFLRTPFSYCIALEHLEFLDESGGINENVFEFVVDCVINGEK